jgi:hypothetical protein
MERSLLYSSDRAPARTIPARVALLFQIKYSLQKAQEIVACAPLNSHQG